IFVSTDGYVLEGPRSSVVIATDDGLQTPPPSLPILHGTTQQALFEVATEKGHRCEYRALRPADLLAAHGIWLVSSITLAARVHTLDGRQLPQAKLAAELAELVDLAIVRDPVRYRGCGKPSARSPRKSTPREVVAVYKQVLDPVAHSLGWSSLVAAIPLLVLFVMLGVLRITAWVASLVSLAVAIAIAIAVYGMPVGQALLAGTEGAAFGFFPILWIVINAIWVYQMTVETGHSDVLRRSFARVSDDQRIQAIIIAFSFGALLEALAGFGTPVAVTSVMLIALG